jgi:acyl-CoA synthetase (NDP forming)
MAHELDRLFCPKSVAIVGAGLNDPARMGTRTLHDLVQSGWQGEIWPVSSRHEELYGLPVWRSLRDLPAAPDVVLARTPSAGIEALIDDAVAAGAGFLVVLASGFAESGDAGLAAQSALVKRARAGGLRIVGPQSIGFVNSAFGLPLSLSQIMERFEMRAGPVALLAQSGAMAISLAVRGQQHVGLDFGLVATLGNAADVTPVDALDWLAGDSHVRAIGLYMEGLDDAGAFALAVQRCQSAGQRIAVLRSGLSRRGAAAVASHTASMSGDGDAFRALCSQLGVVLCDSSEAFLWTLKALATAHLQGTPRVAFASISGGACALWADHCERLGLALPEIGAVQAAALAARLPPFLQPANPLDLGPAVFDDAAFQGTLCGLLADPAFNVLVVYLFTSSPTLMGGLQKVRQLEILAREARQTLWLIWEAATDEEWAALARSEVLVAFRDLGQCAQALAAAAASGTGRGFRPATQLAAPTRAPALDTEPLAKAWLRAAGLQAPRGAVCVEVEAAQAFAATCPDGVAVKIVSPKLPHKTDVGGVLLSSAEPAAVGSAHAQVLANVRLRCPEVEPVGVLVEERVVSPGVELLITVRRDAVMGLVSIIGRGGVRVEVDRDFVVHVGMLLEGDLLSLIGGLRCAPLLLGHRGRPALALDALERSVLRLQLVVLSSDVAEVELNPVLLTCEEAWVLDALVAQPPGHLGN